MTTKEIGRLMFFIPVGLVVGWSIGTIILCTWEAAKSADRLEQYYDNPNSIRHRIHFFIWMLIISCIIVGFFLADIS
jgi:hypothetical protein